MYLFVIEDSKYREKISAIEQCRDERDELRSNQFQCKLDNTPNIVMAMATQGVDTHTRAYTRSRSLIDQQSRACVRVNKLNRRAK